MGAVAADWRLFGDHEHLRGATLWWRMYAPRNAILAQDQCEFCWATFARSGEEAWHEGYATQAPHGAGVREAPQPEPVEEEDEYITGVMAAVRANPPAEPPAVDEPDPEVEAALFEAIKLPSSAVEPAKTERVTWICPQCFEDFKDLFGWQVKSEG
jgi:hypothetical protein